MKSRYNEEMINAQSSDEILVLLLEDSLISQEYAEDQFQLPNLESPATEIAKGLSVSEKRLQEPSCRGVSLAPYLEGRFQSNAVMNALSSGNLSKVRNAWNRIILRFLKEAGQSEDFPIDQRRIEIVSRASHR